MNEFYRFKHEWPKLAVRRRSIQAWNTPIYQNLNDRYARNNSRTIFPWTGLHQDMLKGRSRPQGEHQDVSDIVPFIAL